MNFFTKFSLELLLILVDFLLNSELAPMCSTLLSFLL